jgi:hypothetical protein
MSEVKTIGFFGDSFCANVNCPGNTNYETYIKKLKNHYEASLVCFGHGGSSIYDLFLIQLKKYLEYKIPDVCVLVWSGPDRLFHRDIRNINFSSAINEDNRYFNRTKTEESELIWSTAANYYKYLADMEYIELQYISILHYIDHTFLPTFEDKTKFIHMFSYSKSISEKYIPYYNFKTGVQINPPLFNLSLAGYTTDLATDNRPNHLEGTYKNQLLFETIKEAIDNYEHGKVLTYTIDEEKNNK